MSHMDSFGTPPTMPGSLGVGSAPFSPGMQNLLNTSGWLKFLGVLAIISGILTALTIIGIIIAWLPIWLGVCLFQAGGRFSIARQTNDAGMASMGARSLALAIKIIAITYLVGILFYVIVFLGMAGSMAMMF